MTVSLSLSLSLRLNPPTPHHYLCDYLTPLHLLHSISPLATASPVKVLLSLSRGHSQTHTQCGSPENRGRNALLVIRADLLGLGVSLLCKKVAE